MSGPYPTDPVLVVDDEAEIRSSVAAALLLSGITHVVECPDGDAAEREVRGRPFSAVVLDLTMPGLAGLPLLRSLLEECPQTPVIVATGTGDLETAVDCMKVGAFDFLTKPIDRTRLVTSVRHALERYETAREVNSLREGMLRAGPSDPAAFSAIVTADPAMHAIFRYMEALAPTALPVLVTGETGVGKELIARALHALSRRSGGFVAVNVAGLDDTLFADTLFGHMKGAFTGADSAREGMIAKAEEGTLFLDEIGDLAPESQIKLLRLLQEKEYLPLGTDRPRPTNARFVFATNLDMGRATENGRFRKDLLYRLKSHHIRIPPLRERPGDLPLLFEHFLEQSRRDDRQGEADGPPRNHPGAPRVLVPRQCPRARGSRLRRGRASPVPGTVPAELPRRHRAQGGRRSCLEPDDPSAADAADDPFAPLQRLPTLKGSSRMLIAEAMRRADGNQAVAAQMLGITRTALNRRLNRKA